MAKSDTEDCGTPTVIKDHRKRRQDVEDKSNDNTIHSGHFMVTNVHDEEEEVEELPIVVKGEQVGYDFKDAKKEPAQTYTFGNKCSNTLEIESSLTKLFQCMTLAYSGKLTSPKWKNFKGIYLPVKEKIRLNNIIWREWHIQYIKQGHPVICQFEPPISDKTHMKPEAVVLEGKYWKRRLESVTREYKKWRMFFRNSARTAEDQKDMQEIASHAELLDRVGQQTAGHFRAPLPPPPPPQSDFMTDEDFMMDLSDTLFTSLNQTNFAFPNPREFNQICNADFIQPGLIQLQPNLDDFMDTIEPLTSFQDMLNWSSAGSSKASNTVMDTSPIQGQDPLFDTTKSLLGGGIDTKPNFNFSPQPQTHEAPAPIPFTSPSLDESMCSPDASVVSSTDTSLNSGLNISSSDQQQLLEFVLNSPEGAQLLNFNQANNTITIQPNQVLNFQQLQQQQQQQEQQQQSQQQNIAKTVTIIPTTTSLQDLLRGDPVFQQVQSPPQTVSPAHIQNSPSPQQQTTLTQNKQNNRVKHHSGPTSTATRKGSENKPIKTERDSSTRARRASGGGKNKKDGNFLIPQNPSTPKSRQQIKIAPSPADGNLVSSKNNKNGTKNTVGTAVSKQNTYLAHLLKGTIPNFPLKEEPPTVTPKSFQSILPKESKKSDKKMPTKNSVSFAAIAPSVNDFQKNLLNEAASHAVGATTLRITDILSPPQNPLSPGDNSQPSSPQFQSPSPDSGGARSRHASSESIGSPYNKDERNGKLLSINPDHRQKTHKNSEHKRRCNIKCGFDLLHQLVPSLSQNPNVKVSKAATLQKSAEYCQKLKVERQHMQEEAEQLKKEIEALNNDISICQSQLPATGVPVTRQRADQAREMFDKYVKDRTLQNWKFWIFSIIIRPLFESFNNMVSTASLDELCRTVLTWLEQHCSLVVLRPGVLNSLRHLSTTTSILSDPSKVPEQAALAVTKNMEDKS